MLFLLILTIVILAFGDMFFTIISVDSDECPANFGNEEPEGEEINPFCVSAWLSYFEIYKLVVGAVEAAFFPPRA